ncbi:MAG: DUF3761 domain-containing protein [Beijerinckiaceae bacterium]|nr:MAG: DUF3761 domain-containing protein [Beijerinckiaceae bacterium]
MVCRIFVYQQPAYAGAIPSSCHAPHSYYRSADRSEVHGECCAYHLLAGATALCRDGSQSFSHHPHAFGTCSHHGGVAKSLRVQTQTRLV